MSTEAKEPGQRAYEAWLGPRHGSAWLELDEGGKSTWAAVEQACAVPVPSAPAVEAWVPCRHGYMPKSGEKVLFWCRGWLDGATAGAGAFNGDFWEDETQADADGLFKLIPSSEVTHWQPLPPPPKESR